MEAQRGASPLGCCRASKPMMNDYFTPVQSKTDKTPQQVHRWRTNCSVMSLATQGEHIYAGGESGDIIIYNINTFEEEARLTGHHGSVYSLVLTPEGKFLFSGASDSLVKVWDTQRLVEVYTIYSMYDIGDVFSAAWVASQQTLYFGAQNASIQWLRLYEASHTQDPSSLPSHRFDKFFDSRGPGGKLCPQQNAAAVQSSSVTPRSDGTEAYLLEVPPRNNVQYAHYGYVYTMLVTQLGTEEVLITGGGDGAVKIWSTQYKSGPQLKHHFESDDDDSVLSMACHDNFLYCGTASGKVVMYDLDTLQMVRVDTVGSHRVMALAVHDDCLYRGTRDFVSKWDPKHYSRAQWSSHDGLTLASVVVQTSNGSSKLITGGNDKSIAMWDLEVFKKDRANVVAAGSSGVRDIAALDHENMIKTLTTFVSYKTVSGYDDGEYIRDCRRCATFLKSLMQHFGAEASLIPVEGGNPIVHGVFKANKQSRSRILFYGHYDVIIANDTDKWETDPFTLTALDGYMYGRGVSDNKGPIVAAIFAAAEKLQSGELENDIVFLIEGEEESGSSGFQETIIKHQKAIGQVDWIILSNSFWLDDQTPCLNYGLRGIVNASIEIKSGKPDLHSGVHGGCFREPTVDMVTLLGQLSDGRGRVAIPGFYDMVRELTTEEEELYDAIVKTTLTNDKQMLMQKWRFPSMTIHRVSVSGPGNSTVIPASATAQISFRIVPDQDIETIRLGLQHHLETKFAEMDSENAFALKFANAADPWIGDPDSAAFRTLRAALRKEWDGVDPLFIREGGSIPVVRFLEKVFTAKAAQLPCGQASDGAHLDNERLRVTNFVKTRNVLRQTFSEL